MKNNELLEKERREFKQAYDEQGQHYIDVIGDRIREIIELQKENDALKNQYKCLKADFEQIKTEADLFKTQWYKCYWELSRVKRMLNYLFKRFAE